MAESKTVKLPKFDGAHEGFHIWWMRFTAYATVFKFVQALREGGEAELPGTEAAGADETTAAGRATKRNAIAMASFTMAFTKEKLIGMIKRAKTAT